MEDPTKLSKSLFGYKRAEVDQLFNRQSETIGELEKQLEILHEKMNSLEEELNYYKEIEQVLTEGIVDARLKGQEIIEESKDNAHELIDRTNEQVSQYKEDFVHHSKELVTNAVSLKDQFNDMKLTMQNMINQCQQVLNETDFNQIFPEKKMDYLLDQVANYESDQLEFQLTNNFPAEAHMTEHEKEELARLIEDVYAYEEEQTLTENEDKEEEIPNENVSNLVEFTPANHK